eukprot:3151238-Pyramimonas_sp.AAC.1
MAPPALCAPPWLSQRRAEHESSATLASTTTCSTRSDHVNVRARKTLAVVAVEKRAEAAAERRRYLLRLPAAHPARRWVRHGQPCHPRRGERTLTLHGCLDDDTAAGCRHPQEAVHRWYARGPSRVLGRPRRTTASANTR